MTALSTCNFNTHLGPWPGSFGPQGPGDARLRGSATRTNVLNDNNDVTQPTGLTYICTISVLCHSRIAGFFSTAVSEQTLIIQQDSSFTCTHRTYIIHAS